MFYGGRLIYEARGARSGGLAAGTLRGLRPAGVPPGTQCAPTPRIRGDLRSTGYPASRSLYEKKSRKGTPCVPRSPLYAPYCGCTRSTRVLSTY